MADFCTERRARRALTPVVAAMLAFELSGCVMAAPSAFQIASYAADGASYAATGKSVTDHLISEVTAKDCAMTRLLDGEDICKEREPARMPDGSIAPNAQDVALGVQPAQADQEFRSFALTQADTGDEDGDETLDAPVQSFADASAPQAPAPEAVTSAPSMPVAGEMTTAQNAAAPVPPVGDPIPAPLRAHAAPSIPVYTEGAAPLKLSVANVLEAPKPQPPVRPQVRPQVSAPKAVAKLHLEAPKPQPPVRSQVALHLEAPKPQPPIRSPFNAQAEVQTAAADQVSPEPVLEDPALQEPQPEVEAQPGQADLDPVQEEALAQDSAQDLGRDLGDLVGDDEDEILDAFDIQSIERAQGGKTLAD